MICYTIMISQTLNKSIIINNIIYNFWNVPTFREFLKLEKHQDKEQYEL